MINKIQRTTQTDWRVCNMKRCSKCNQIDVGQTGEYSCSDCGLPTVWDEQEIKEGDKVRVFGQFTDSEIFEVVKYKDGRLGLKGEEEYLSDVNYVKICEENDYLND